MRVDRHLPRHAWGIAEELTKELLSLGTPQAFTVEPGSPSPRSGAGLGWQQQLDSDRLMVDMFVKQVDGGPDLGLDDLVGQSVRDQDVINAPGLPPTVSPGGVAGGRG
eukprot:6089517-Lingulodinium_polyedra.AAC.1